MGSFADYAREYGELCNDSPPRGKPQIQDQGKVKIKRPLRDPAENHGAPPASDQTNNNETEGRDFTTPPGKGVRSVELQQSCGIEDIAELPHNADPSHGINDQSPGDDSMEEEEEKFSLPTSLSSQDGGANLQPPDTAYVGEGVQQVVDFLETNPSEKEGRRYKEGEELFSLPTSLSSKLDEILPHPLQSNINNNEVVSVARFKIKKAIKKVKKRSPAKSSKIGKIKRAYGKKWGRVNDDKHLKSLRNAKTDLKRDVMSNTPAGHNGDNANTANGEIPWQIMYDLKKKGTELAKMYLPRILRYVAFGGVMGALGYMQGVNSLKE